MAIGHTARCLDWELRLTTLESKRLRVEFLALTVDARRNQTPADGRSTDRSEQQLEAYCEAVKRLTSQGVDTEQAVEVLRHCGGDLDAAEVWLGVCSSIGLYSIPGQSVTGNRAWVYEDERGFLRFANNLDRVSIELRESGNAIFQAVAEVISNVSLAVTAEMRQEVACLESARQRSQQPHTHGLSVDQICALLQSSNKQVLAIHEVVNPALWKLYTQHKESMTDPNEQWLFHGSGPENIASIALDGFDVKLAKSTGSFGAGVYFAKKVSTSLSYTTREALKALSSHASSCQGRPEMLDKARSMNVHVMLLCSVLVGRIGGGQGGQTKASAGFDSAGGCSMSVIYNAAQAYPRYMIFLQ